MPVADVSVRPAVAGDQAAYARIQIAAWALALSPDDATAIDADAVAAGWEAAILSPPSRGHRAFTALAAQTIVGFAAIAPNGDLVALEIDPAHRRQGHGSRLLAAAVDALRTQGCAKVRAWVLEGDDAREAFLSGAGLAPGGVARSLESASGLLRETLWVAEL